MLTGWKKTWGEIKHIEMYAHAFVCLLCFTKGVFTRYPAQAVLRDHQMK